MTYNTIIDRLDTLIDAMREIGKNNDASVSQITVAYAVNKDTYSIIGVTKSYQVEEALQAAKINFTPDEISRLEK